MNNALKELLLLGSVHMNSSEPFRGYLISNKVCPDCCWPSALNLLSIVNHKMQ